MREIEFRAWDSMFGMKKVTGIDFEKQIVKLLNEQQGESFEVNLGRIRLMQYTGLKDKNGKEIYEGDIILHTTTRGVRGMYPKPTNRVATIVYSSDFCRFGLDYVEQGVDMGEMMEGRVKEYEIIGNIYENPELLKEANE